MAACDTLIWLSDEFYSLLFATVWQVSTEALSAIDFLERKWSKLWNETLLSLQTLKETPQMYVVLCSLCYWTALCTLLLLTRCSFFPMHLQCSHLIFQVEFYNCFVRSICLAVLNKYIYNINIKYKYNKINKLLPKSVAKTNSKSSLQYFKIKYMVLFNKHINSYLEPKS